MVRVENIGQIIAQKILIFDLRILLQKNTENHPRHILMKNKGKEKILPEKKKHITYRRTRIQMI